MVTFGGGTEDDVAAAYIVIRPHGVTRRLRYRSSRPDTTL